MLVICRRGLDGTCNGCASSRPHEKYVNCSCDMEGIKCPKCIEYKEETQCRQKK